MQYNDLLEKQIIGRLKVDNPWWTENEIAPFYSEMHPRLYLDIFYPLVCDEEVRRAIILMGPRRVGKTVMLYHTIQRLITDGVSPRNIIYISVETPIYNNIYLEQLFTLAKQALGKSDSKEKFYVFFDEIQYLKDWEVNLKSLVDTYLNVKFVASGSAAAELKKRSNESGAGRFTDFHLPPLTFYEYVHLKDYSQLLYPVNMEWSNGIITGNATIDISKLNALFIDYINYGGYPEVVFSQRIQEDPGQFIRHDIIDKVLLRDLPSLYGITDVQELNSLFTMIAYHSGSQFSYEGLSKDSGVKKDTLRKYIQYLEAAFLVRKIRRADDTARQYRREMLFKLYLTNPSLRCALFQPIEENDEFVGNMVETAVYAQWFPRNTNIAYANWNCGNNKKGEVDIVGIDEARQKPLWAVEVKWSNRPFVNPVEELKSLESFMKTNNLSHAIVTSISETGKKDMPYGCLQFMPVACYAYTVGEGTLMLTKASYGL